MKHPNDTGLATHASQVATVCEEREGMFRPPPDTRDKLRVYLDKLAEAGWIEWKADGKGFRFQWPATGEGVTVWELMRIERERPGDPRLIRRA